MILHGRNVGIYIKGVDVTGDLNSIQPVTEQELADVTCFGDAGHCYYPGLSKDLVAIEAVYDTTATAVWNDLVQDTASGFGVMVTYKPTTGADAYCTPDAALKGQAIKSNVTDANRASINLEATKYLFEPCLLLTDGIYTTGIASTGDGTALNCLSASATTGGTAYLQAFSVVGGTLTVHIEDSATGAFGGEETTTCTFAAASSSEAQHIRLTSQIQQYARVSWIGATSTASFAVALHRD